MSYCGYLGARTFRRDLSRVYLVYLVLFAFARVALSVRANAHLPTHNHMSSHTWDGTRNHKCCKLHLTSFNGAFFEHFEYLAFPTWLANTLRLVPLIAGRCTSSFLLSPR